MTGYVDLQVNGYFGVDFNADVITENEMLRACRQLAADGVESALATVITAPSDAMQRRLTRLVELIENQPEVAAVIAGVHLEGPFISPLEGYVGAHPVDSVQAADVALMGRLLDAGRGQVRLVTLAPEMDRGAALTRWLTDAGIVVAAGHTAASRDQLSQSLDAGLRMFTHLGNGCPALLPRHDNIIQRVLSLADRMMISFIADGHHIPPHVLRNYLHCVPPEHVVIVTDAISAAGLGPGLFRLGDQVVEVEPDGAAWSADRLHFAGSAATMPKMKQVLTENVGLTETAVDRFLIDNPRRLLG